MSGGYEEALRITNKKHDLVTVSVTDPREVEMPPIGFLELEDAETGETIVIDTYDVRVRNQFSEIASLDTERLVKEFKRMKVDHVPLRTDQPYIDPLIRFFQQRASRY